MVPKLRKIFLMLILLINLLNNSVTFGLDNGLARTPPMGWMTWQRFRCQVDCSRYPNDCISEALMIRNAKKIVIDGYRDLGYKYLIVDDCWSEKQRDPLTHKIVADHKRFPNGLKYLGEQLHSQGLQFGVYLDYGTYTCGGYPGSINYLKLDAQSLAEWGADYTKVDSCYCPEEEMASGYGKFGQFLNLTGRPIVFSCSYPAYIDWFNNATRIDWQRLQDQCNLWRMLGDIQDAWSSVIQIIASYEQRSGLLSSIAGPGHWNDPDMLLMGNYGLSRDQQQVQMGMWCMLAAPLIMSTDMYTIDKFSVDLLKNTLLIAIDQDEGGHQAQYIKTKDSVKFWSRRLTLKSSGSWAIALMNPVGGGGPIRTTVSLSEFNLETEMLHSTSKYQLINVFTHTVMPTVYLEQPFDISINPTGLQMFYVEMVPVESLQQIILELQLSHILDLAD